MRPEKSPAIVLHSQVASVHSSIVGDDYELAVWLPPDYATSGAAHPVLCVLDSPFAFGMAVPIVLGQIWEGLLPELIVVGIGKGIRSYDEWWPIRSRDYSPFALPDQEGSGQAAAFLQSLRSEILPLIDEEFRTDQTNRTVWGHSLGGAFTIYALIHGTDVFHRYIATSPAVVQDGQRLIDIESGLPPQGSELHAHLFVSVGSLDQEYKPHIDTFTAAMRDKHYRQFHLTTALLEGYSHVAAGPPGFIRGLRAVFSQ